MSRWICFASCAVVAMASGLAQADVAPLIDRVEEDWEIVIREPSPDEEAPQILNVISPNGTEDNDFFVFELNHATQPSYTAGGLQLQHWNGDTVREWTAFEDSSQLATPGETIRYTIRLRLYEEYLSVTVREGDSDTWGDFHSEPLRIVHDTSLTDLNGYQTSNSVEKSRVGFASHRVGHFVLKEVRYYSDGNLIRRDTTDYVVHEYTP